MTIIAIALLTFIASVVGTITGFGVSTLMIPLLVSWFPLAETLLFVGVIHLVTDIWKLLFFHAGIRWRVLLFFGGAGIFASYLGALLSVQAAVQPLFMRILGGFVVGYAVFLIVRPLFSLVPTVSTMMQGGMLSGFLAGLFGMGGALRSLFLLSFNFEKTVYLATDGAIALVVDLARLWTYVGQGAALEQPLLQSLVVCIPLSFLGAKGGEWAVRVVSQKQFRLIVASFLLLIGIKLVIFG